MTTDAALRRKAVDYAVKQIKAGTDYPQIEWALLNIDEFKPLRASFDPECLYDEISEILSTADDLVEDERRRNAERAADYEQQYPELDDVMKREQ